MYSRFVRCEWSAARVNSATSYVDGIAIGDRIIAKKEEEVK